MSADMRSVLFMLFNPVRDELITGGVGGTKVGLKCIRSVSSALGGKDVKCMRSASCV